MLSNRLVSAVGPENRATLVAKLREIVDWWSVSSMPGLRYKSEPQFNGLMEFFGVPHRDPARPTLNSMRHVDGEVKAFIRGAGALHDR